MAVSTRAETAVSQRAGEPARVVRMIGLARRNTSISVGGLIVGVLVVAAVLAPLIVPYDQYAMNPAARLEPPSAANILGTDNYGRDLLTRLVYGARVSLVVGLASIVVAAVIGVSIGSRCRGHQSVRRAAGVRLPQDYARISELQSIMVSTDHRIEEVCVVVGSKMKARAGAL